MCPQKVQNHYSKVFFSSNIWCFCEALAMKFGGISSLNLGLSRRGEGKEPPANAGDIRDSVPSLGLGRSPGGACGNPFQYLTCRIPVEREAWWAAVRGVADSRTRLKQLSRHASLKLNQQLKTGPVSHIEPKKPTSPPAPVVATGISK